jgi:hypothetical protein
VGSPGALGENPASIWENPSGAPPNAGVRGRVGAVPMAFFHGGTARLGGRCGWKGCVVRKWLLLLFIPVLAVAGGYVCREAFAKPPSTVLPGVVVSGGPGASPTAVVPPPLPPVPPPGYSAVDP